MGIVHGVLSLSVSAVKVSVNMTIWNGTIMENTNMKYTILQMVLPTREMYHAAIDVQSRMSATDKTVITTLYSTER